MGLARFMASMAGRLLRVVAGVALVWVGYSMVGGTGGWVLVALGVVMFLAGALNFCLFGPLFSAPFWGKDIKAE